MMKAEEKVTETCCAQCLHTTATGAQNRGEEEED